MTRIPTGWKVYRLDELGFVGRGRSRHRPRNDPSLLGGSYPFVQTSDIKSTHLRLHDFSQTYNEIGLAQSKMWEPGTLCITIAANIAETAILAIPACFPDSVIGFLADPKKADAVFIKYCIDFMKLRMQQVSHGTTQDNLSVDKLLHFDFIVPEAPVQRKIAAILSTYDDLIENNLRRIKILEEMAQTLYREWFVKFRFPGHRDARFTDSPLGRIPEGWEVVNLLDITVVKYGKNLPTKNLAPDGDYPVYGAAKIIGRYTEYTREERTIITGCRGSVGEMQITLPKCFVTNNSFTFEVQQRIDFFWLFHSLKERGFADVIGGAAQPQITLDGLSKVQILVPLKATRALFHEHAKDMFSLLWNLEGRNTTLRQTRDLLLPKLISGKLDVSELDITIPEAKA